MLALPPGIPLAMLSLLLSCLFLTTESVLVTLASGMLCCCYVVSAIRHASLAMLSLPYIFQSRHIPCSNRADYAILAALRYHRHRLSLSCMSVTNPSSPSSQHTTCHDKAQTHRRCRSMSRSMSRSDSELSGVHLSVDRAFPHTVGTLAATPELER